MYLSHLDNYSFGNSSGVEIYHKPPMKLRFFSKCTIGSAIFGTSFSAIKIWRIIMYISGWVVNYDVMDVIRVKLYYHF